MYDELLSEYVLSPTGGCRVLQLGYRFAHILRRMLPIAMFLLQKEGQFLTGHDLFLKRIGAAYHAFLEESEVLAATMPPARCPPAAAVIG